MPLTFDFVAAPGASLGTFEPLTTTIGALPGFEAYFVAGSGETLVGSAVSAWAATVGSGTLGNAQAIKRPTKATRNDADVISFDGTQVLALSGLTIGMVAAYTIGIRFWQRSHDLVDTVQTICGNDTGDDFLADSRFANSEHYYEVDSADTRARANAPQSDGYRTLVLAQGGGASKLSINGGTITTVAGATANLPTFNVGGGRNNIGTAFIDVRSVILARADLTANADHYDTLLKALEIA